MKIFIRNVRTVKIYGKGVKNFVLYIRNICDNFRSTHGWVITLICFVFREYNTLRITVGLLFFSNYDSCSK